MILLSILTFIVIVGTFSTGMCMAILFYDKWPAFRKWVDKWAVSDYNEWINRKDQ